MRMQTNTTNISMCNRQLTPSGCATGAGGDWRDGIGKDDADDAVHGRGAHIL